MTKASQLPIDGVIKELKAFHNNPPIKHPRPISWAMITSEQARSLSGVTYFPKYIRESWAVLADWLEEKEVPR